MNEINGGHVNGREIAVETLMVITALAVVVGAVYLWNYAHGNGLAGDSLIKLAEQRLAGYKPTPAELAASLQAAQARLAKQSAVLAAMKADFPSSPALDKQITDAYAAAAAAIAKTDKLFNDPDSSDLSLKNAAADPARAAAIESLRREINADMAAWKAASADAGSTLALSQAALAELQIMQAYLNQLQNYLAALPPSNALQSDVIIAYQSQIADDAAAVNGAIDQVDAVGAPPIASTDLNSNAPGNGQAGNDSNSNANAPGNNSMNGSTGSGGSSSRGDQSNGDNSSGSTNPSSGSNGNTPPPTGGLPPVVTVGDILAAQATVDQTGGQIQSIEQQINNYDVMPSGGSGSNSSDSNTSQSSGSNGDYIQYIPPEDQPSSGPKLIQGDNPFQ